MLANSSRLWQFRSDLFLLSVLQTRLYGTARSKMPKILCVAEKPSISKAVAGHLSGGQIQTVSVATTTLGLTHATDSSVQRNTRNQYIKNYCFEFDFGPPWGRCDVTMTAVLGHLTSTEFGPQYKNWSHPPPSSLFNAPVLTAVSDVRPDALALTTPTG